MILPYIVLRRSDFSGRAAACKGQRAACGKAVEAAARQGPRTAVSDSFSLHEKGALCKPSAIVFAQFLHFIHRSLQGSSGGERAGCGKEQQRPGRSRGSPAAKGEARPWKLTAAGKMAARGKQKPP